MTVGYMREASTAGVFTFLSLLFKWKGSVWKSIWHELLIWLWLYFSISIFYRFYLRDTPQGEVFEQLVMFSDRYIKTAASSLTFVLGFYVTHVATRWWNIFMQLPWPDSPCLAIASMLRSKGDQHKNEERRLRRTIVRYLTLSFVLVLRDISERIRRRFPDLTYLIPALMTEEERQRILKVREKERDRACIFWLPIEWILMILKRCYEEKTLDETHFVCINKHILNYRNNLNNLLSYDWINTPLVYTQVVNLATTFYFVMCLLAKQFIANEKSDQDIWKCDYVIPVFTIFEFIFYVGWLKVAQVMLNPFGMDDDDFEVDFLIERNLKIGYCMIDEVFDDPPRLVDVTFEVLPHTMASAKNLAKMNPMVGSVATMEIDRHDAQMISHELLRKHHDLMRKSILQPRMASKEKVDKEKSLRTRSFHSNDGPMELSTKSMLDGKVHTSEGFQTPKDMEQGSQLPASKEKVDELQPKAVCSKEKAASQDKPNVAYIKLHSLSTGKKTMQPTIKGTQSNSKLKELTTRDSDKKAKEKDIDKKEQDVDKKDKDIDRKEKAEKNGPHSPQRNLNSPPQLRIVNDAKDHEKTVKEIEKTQADESFHAARISKQNKKEKAAPKPTNSDANVVPSSAQNVLGAETNTLLLQPTMSRTAETQDDDKDDRTHSYRNETMALVKVIKNKAYFKRYQVKPRRRRQGKTDFRARKRLTVQDKNKYNTPKRRVVVRFTNKDIVVQFVHSRIEGDIVEEVAYAHELTNYGVRVGLTNQAASYLVGYLAGRRLLTKLNKEVTVKQQEVGDKYVVEEVGSENRRAPVYNLDVGLARTVTGAKIFTVLKGVVDAGIDVPHGESRFFGYDSEAKDASPEAHRDRILGKHVSEYMVMLKEQDEDRYKQQFGKFIAAGVTPEGLEAMYKKARDAIEANPVRATEVSGKREKKPKLSTEEKLRKKEATQAKKREERKARIVAKKAELLSKKEE